MDITVGDDEVGRYTHVYASLRYSTRMTQNKHVQNYHIAEWVKLSFRDVVKGISLLRTELLDYPADGATVTLFWPTFQTSMLAV